MKVKKKQDGSLETMSKTLDHYEEGYIGISLIPKTKLPIYKACIEKLIQTDQTHLHVEAVLNQLVSEGEIIHSLNVSGSWWLEVDTPQDKEKAEKLSQLTLDLIIPGMTVEELYQNGVKLDDHDPEMAPVVYKIMKIYEEKFEKKAIATVSAMVKNKQFGQAQDLVKKVLQFKMRN